MTDEAPGSGRRLRLVLAWALPWSWFLIDDIPGYGEVVAIGMPVVGAAAAVAVALCLLTRQRVLARPRLLSAGATSTLVVAVVAVVWPLSPTGSGTPASTTAGHIRVVSANLLASNRQQAEAVDAIAARDPDVAVLVEVRRRGSRRTARHWPHRRVLTSDVAPDDGLLPVSVIVASHWDLQRLDPPDGVDGARIMRVRVDAPTPFVLYAAHLPRPWWRGPTRRDFQATLADQQRIAAAVALAVEDETLPVVLAGDLNLTDRGPGYATMTTTLTDAMRSAWARPTSRRWWWLLLRIDHILTDPGWCADRPFRMDLVGSDHRAVGVTLDRCGP